MADDDTQTAIPDNQPPTGTPPNVDVPPEELKKKDRSRDKPFIQLHDKDEAADTRPAGQRFMEDTGPGLVSKIGTAINSGLNATPQDSGTQRPDTGMVEPGSGPAGGNPIQDYLQGKHAMDAKTFNDEHQKANPDGTLDPNVANLKVLTSQPTPEAQQAALEAMHLRYNQGRSMARVAADQGHHDTSAKWLTAAMKYVPDGNDTTITAAGDKMVANQKPLGTDDPGTTRTIPVQQYPSWLHSDATGFDQFMMNNGAHTREQATPPTQGAVPPMGAPGQVPEAGVPPPGQAPQATPQAGVPPPGQVDTLPGKEQLAPEFAPPPEAPAGTKWPMGRAQSGQGMAANPPVSVSRNNDSRSGMRYGAGTPGAQQQEQRSNAFDRAAAGGTNPAPQQAPQEHPSWPGWQGEVQRPSIPSAQSPTAEGGSYPQQQAQAPQAQPQQQPRASAGVSGADQWAQQKGFKNWADMQEQTKTSSPEQRAKSDLADKHYRARDEIVTDIDQKQKELRNDLNGLNAGAYTDHVLSEKNMREAKDASKYKAPSGLATDAKGHGHVIPGGESDQAHEQKSEESKQRVESGQQMAHPLENAQIRQHLINSAQDYINKRQDMLRHIDNGVKDKGGQPLVVMDSKGHYTYNPNTEQGQQLHQNLHALYNVPLGGKGPNQQEVSDRTREHEAYQAATKVSKEERTPEQQRIVDRVDAQVAGPGQQQQQQQPGFFSRLLGGAGKPLFQEGQTATDKDGKKIIFKDGGWQDR